MFLTKIEMFTEKQIIVLIFYIACDPCHSEWSEGSSKKDKSAICMVKKIARYAIGMTN
jgi:hypothetical protein